MRKILTKLFGDPNEAPLKPYQKVVRAGQCARAPDGSAIRSGAARAGERAARSPGRGRDARRSAAGVVRGHPRGGVAAPLASATSTSSSWAAAVLHDGKIAEMRTGEGKTLTATLAVALNALTGAAFTSSPSTTTWPSATRSGWARSTTRSVCRSACIQHDAAFIYDPDWVSEDERLARLRPISRREAYEADITYGTNNEFGFDYLRDNMVPTADQHGAARAGLRHRRRGRQHPDRRGAHAADHLRPGRAGDRPLLPVRPDREAAARRAATTRSTSSTRQSR